MFSTLLCHAWDVRHKPICRFFIVQSSTFWMMLFYTDRPGADARFVIVVNYL